MVTIRWIPDPITTMANAIIALIGFPAAGDAQRAHLLMVGLWTTFGMCPGVQRQAGHCLKSSSTARRMLTNGKMPAYIVIPAMVQPCSFKVLTHSGRPARSGGALVRLTPPR